MKKKKKTGNINFDNMGPLIALVSERVQIVHFIKSIQNM